MASYYKYPTLLQCILHVIRILQLYEYHVLTRMDLFVYRYATGKWEIDIVMDMHMCIMYHDSTRGLRVQLL